jgi:hypothetical protein
MITLDPKHIPQLDRILVVRSVLKFADNGILCLRRTMLNYYVIFYQTIDFKKKNDRLLLRLRLRLLSRHIE